MDTWKKYISAGNQAFQKKQFESAEQHYRLACVRSAALLPNWFDVADCVAALVVSHQNLAEVKLLQGSFDRAINIYDSLDDILQKFVGDSTGERLQVVQSARRRLATELHYVIKKYEFSSIRAQSLLARLQQPVTTYAMYPKEKFS